MAKPHRSAVPMSAAAAATFSSYDLGTPLGHHLVTVHGKSYVELEGVVFDAEGFCFRRTSSLLCSPPRSGSPDYSPDSTPEWAPLDYSPASLTPSTSQRSGSPDYSPASSEYTPLTPPSSRRSGSPDYSPASPEYTPLTPTPKRSGSPFYWPATPEYTPLRPPPKRSGSPGYWSDTPEYTPLTPSSQRSGSPDYSPATLEYTPLAPSSRRSGSPDYSPATPEYTPQTPSSCGFSDFFDHFDGHCTSPSAGHSSRAASPSASPAIPEYTPGSPSGGRGSPDYSMLFDNIEDFCYSSPPPPSPAGYSLLAASPEYTPVIAEYAPFLWRASSPDYTPSSPSVSDAVSRTSPSSHRRHHPYRRSRSSFCHRRRSSSQHGY